MAGVGDDVDERRLVVLLGNGGGIHALGHQVTGLDGPQVQTHGRADTLAGDGALQEDGVAVQRLIAGNDDVGQLVHALVAPAGIGHAGNLGEDLLADVRDQGRDASHI